MSSTDANPVVLDARGRPRTAVTTPGYKPRRPPASKGRRYEPHPFTTTEIQALFAACVAQRRGPMVPLM
jgi:hypothetical protein